MNIEIKNKQEAVELRLALLARKCSLRRETRILQKPKRRAEAEHRLAVVEGLLAEVDTIALVLLQRHVKYRALEVGEIIQAGDELRDANCDVYWRPVRYSIGTIKPEGSGVEFRRPV
jgi:predicted house-cleaning NTP pyrophosphatase (Maf/HAM1 superfamily)